MQSIKDTSFVNRFIFPAPPGSYGPTAKAHEPPLVWLPLGGGAYTCMRIYLCGVSDRPILLYAHGNGEDIGHCGPQLRNWGRALGCNTAVVEYIGYGLCAAFGTASEGGCKRSIDAAMFFLINELHIPPSQIFVWGRSIGTGVACGAVANHPASAALGGLILTSPYLSVKSLCKTLVGSAVAAFVMERFNNKKEIEKVTCPVLIIHGKMDTLIPYQHAQELHTRCRSANKTLALSETATHNDFDDEADVLTHVAIMLSNWQSSTPHPITTPLTAASTVIPPAFLTLPPLVSDWISSGSPQSQGVLRAVLSASSSALEASTGLVSTTVADCPQVDQNHPPPLKH
ncbi:alpha/beta superfamily hydrolase [Pelomyxa schiedti]|nr:alpha/beta superfamily hydrolase [Pelomyxa schiedti]